MKDVRTCIEDMEERHPGEILRVQRPVDARFEISSVIRRLQEERKFPAVFFESVRGSDHGVITNVHATRERMVYGMGVSDRKAMLRAWSERLDNPIAPIDVETGPVKEVIHLGEACDLRRLPIVTHAEQDSGAFITAGVLIIRNPDTGEPNIGIYRHMVKGPNRLGCFMNEGTHLFHLLKKAEAKGPPFR